MTIYERIRELRKEHLHLSQTEFGERLGISRGSVANIELNTLARPDQKEPIYKLICKEFNVNYSWLIDGTGEPFSTDLPDDTYVRATAEIDVRDPRARNAIIDYWRLNEEDKKLFWNFMERFIEKKQED